MRFNTAIMGFTMDLRPVWQNEKILIADAERFNNCETLADQKIYKLLRRR